jgi:hypothetical protein
MMLFVMILCGEARAEKPLCESCVVRIIYDWEENRKLETDKNLLGEYMAYILNVRVQDAKIMPRK